MRQFLFIIKTSVYAKEDLPPTVQRLNQYRF